MTEVRFITKEGEPDPSDRQALVAGLLSHHAQQGHPRKTDIFSIFIHDEKDKPLGGIIVSFLWGGMHIDSLWVDENERGNDYGTRLMNMAEDEARKRGCTVAYTDTFSWQAPAFYQKMGYTLYGTIENLPPGHSFSYYSKQL